MLYQYVLYTRYMYSVDIGCITAQPLCGYTSKMTNTPGTHVLAVYSKQCSIGTSTHRHTKYQRRLLGSSSVHNQLHGCMDGCTTGAQQHNIIRKIQYTAAVLLCYKLDLVATTRTAVQRVHFSYIHTYKDGVDKTEQYCAATAVYLFCEVSIIVTYSKKKQAEMEYVRYIVGGSKY